MRWAFPAHRWGFEGDRLRARACDDLAGAAAALSALDRLAADGVGHFSVLLTRAEEVGFVGAIAACELKTLPAGARVLSIECSPAVGRRPGRRWSDRAGRRRLERVLVGPDQSGGGSGQIRRRPHQRKLMAGGSCEATAFAALGYEATGLCLALDNYHNMVDIDGVRAGKRKARLAPEAISLLDFHGLVDLLEVVALGLDSAKSNLPQRLRKLYRKEKHVLEVGSVVQVRALEVLEPFERLDRLTDCTHVFPYRLLCLSPWNTGQRRTRWGRCRSRSGPTTAPRPSAPRTTSLSPTSDSDATSSGPWA